MKVRCGYCQGKVTNKGLGFIRCSTCGRAYWEKEDTFIIDMTDQTLYLQHKEV